MVKRRVPAGFTLIELSIVMVIISLLMVGFLNAYKVYLAQRQVDITVNNINNARSQIEAFRARYGYYPCPADASDPRAASGNCSAGAADNPPGLVNGTIAGVPGRVIKTGVVPVTAIADPDGAGPLLPETVLIVSGDKSIDGWRNRLAYAVVDTMADPARAAGAGVVGDIVVNDLGGAQLGANRRYLIFSYGEDGKGAYTMSGTQRDPCTPGAVDSENCNGDEVFVDLAPTDARSFAGGANNYDDFMSSDAIQTRCPSVGGVPQIVVDIAQDGSPVCSAPITCAAGTYFAGMDSTVTPPVPVCRASNCPAGSFFTGVNPANGNPICTANCPSGTYFAGTLATGAPDCRTGSCPGGTFFAGIDPATGGPLCTNNCPANTYYAGSNRGVSDCRPVFPGTACGAGAYLRGINPDGSPDCQSLINDTIANKSCAAMGYPSDWAITGFDGAGNPVCVQSSGIKDVTWADQGGNWKNQGSCPGGYSSHIYQYHPGNNNNADVLLCVKR